MIQKNLFDFLKENSHKNKIYGQNLSQTYFEANFLEHLEEIPVFQEFAVGSNNNCININLPIERINIKEEEHVNKIINRIKSFTFAKRNKIKNEEINEKEESLIATETKFINFPKGYSQIKRASTPSFENNPVENSYNYQILEESPVKKYQKSKKNSKMVDLTVKTPENMKKTSENLHIFDEKQSQNKKSLFHTQVKKINDNENDKNTNKTDRIRKSESSSNKKILYEKKIAPMSQNK